MKFLKWGAIALVALFVVITAVGYLLPSQMKVSRSVTIEAPPETIYPLIANLKDGWEEWSPWKDSEHPHYQSQYSGPREGVGAKRVFEDNGRGEFTITKADPKSGIEYDLVLMNESFRMKGSLLCEGRGPKTEVTWTDDVDYGNNPYYRYFGLMVEGPLGDELEKGLAELKTKAELRAKASLTAEERREN